VKSSKSRRAFLKGVTMTGAVSIISASAKGKDQPAGQSNPVVPNAPESSGAAAEFQSPQRAMWAVSTLAQWLDNRK
jgi:hypothetical protein